MGGEGEGVVDAAALRDDRQGPGRDLARRGDEARAEPKRRSQEAGGVRPDDADAGLGSSARELLLQTAAVVAGLRKAAGVDDRARDASVAARAHDGRHGSGRHREQREVGRFWQVTDVRDVTSRWARPRAGRRSCRAPRRRR
jgi:hypothetical protein